MGKMFENIKQDIPSIIKFEDTGAELYSMALQQKQIDTFNFRLTDAKGREIAEVSADQYSNGALSYKLVLKWEAIHSPEVGQTAGFLSRDHQLETKQENRFITAPGPCPPVKGAPPGSQPEVQKTDFGD